MLLQLIHGEFYKDRRELIPIFQFLLVIFLCNVSIKPCYGKICNFEFLYGNHALNDRILLLHKIAVSGIRVTYLL